MLGLLGDIHGDVYVIRGLIERVKDSAVTAIIQVGDCGWNFRGDAKGFDIPVYFIPGNHEHWLKLAPLDAYTEPQEIVKNLFYVPRGCLFEVDGRKILGVGGAASIDYAYRTKNIDWFPDLEIVVAEHVDRALQQPTPDILVTHTLPDSVRMRLLPGPTPNFGQSSTWFDPSGAELERLLIKYPHTPWFAGHFHRAMRDTVTGIRVLDINEVVGI